MSESQDTMSPERLDYWQGYLDSLKPIMRLVNWDIQILPELIPTDEDVDAQTYITTDYQTARMRLVVNWEELPAWKQRANLLHELVHCHVNPLATFAEEMANQLGSQARMLAFNQIHFFMERSVEELARIVCPYAPLPPRVKEKAA